MAKFARRCRADLEYGADTNSIHHFLSHEVHQK